VAACAKRAVQLAHQSAHGKLLERFLRFMERAITARCAIAWARTVTSFETQVL